MNLVNYLSDQPEIIDNGIFYTSVAQHRKNINNNDKSKWKININEEFRCFRNTLDNIWYISTIGWGLYIDCGRIERLGVNSQNENLYFAKFIDSSSNNYWHGWPADYRRKSQDRPPTHMLKQWRDGGFIEKHQIAKIRGGKVCNF